jgi:PAS domain S-box-containing protein
MRAMGNGRDTSGTMDALARIEAALRDSEAQHRKMIESSLDAVVSMDQAGMIIGWNASAERMFGWSSIDVMGKRLSEVIIPHSLRERHEAGLKRYLREGTGSVINNRVEVSALHRDGHEIPVELSVWPVGGQQRVVFGAFVRDISRRKANERRLRQSEERYRVVIENVAEGILVVQNGLIVFVNPAAERLVGQSLEQLRSQHFATLIHPEDRDLVVERYTRRIRGEEVESHYSFRIRAPGDDTKWVELSAEMIEWEGKPATVSFITDVTERRRLEDSLRQNLDRERELNQLKSRFVSMTSHEFRTPLTAILSSMELIKHYSHKLSEKERLELIASVEDAVRHMTRMLDDVLLIGKAEAGRLEFKPTPVRLADFCSRAIEAARGQAAAGLRGSNEIVFEAHDADVMVMLDDKLMQHVLENLLSNAIKYSPAGGNVRFAVTARDEVLEIVVEDQGIGMPAKDLPHLFESFYRASNVGNISGTGLGLAIVKRAVDLHSGAIHVDSEVGRGTRFTVTLPRVSEEALA